MDGASDVRQRRPGAAGGAVMSRFASTEPTETASRVTTNSAVATRATQLPSHFRDERAFFPFSTAPSIALLGGRLFYCLPHDIRRRIVAGFAPQMFRDLEQFRAGTRAGPYSLQPFDRLRCIFVHIPKAAGVSVCRGLFGGLAGGHAHIGVYQLAFSHLEFSSYFKFAFVRNPGTDSSRPTPSYGTAAWMNPIGDGPTAIPSISTHSRTSS